MKKVIFYKDNSGKEPCKEWIYSQRDMQTRHRILTRIRRVEQGNYGDYKALGRGLFELRMFYGSGYRIYFGTHKNDTVILLIGGNKGSQNEDIKKAKELWKEYHEEETL